MLKASATAYPTYAELTTNIPILDNKIVKGDYDLSKEIPIEMLYSEKTSYGNY